MVEELIDISGIVRCSSPDPVREHAHLVAPHLVGGDGNRSRSIVGRHQLLSPAVSLKWATHTLGDDGQIGGWISHSGL